MTVRIAVFEGAEGFAKQQSKMSSCAAKWRGGGQVANTYKEHMKHCLRGSAGTNLGASPSGENMARHCKKGHCGRGHRRYGELVAIPGLGRHGYAGAFTSAFKGPVGAGSVAVGGGIGLVGAGLGVFLGKKLAKWTTAIPDFVYKLMPLIGATAVGGAAMALQYKKNPSVARGHLLGATLAGAGLTAYSYASQTATLAPHIALNGLVPVRYDDVYVRSGRRSLADVYVRNGQLPMAQYADNPRLAGVMAAAMEDGEDMPELAMLAGIQARRAMGAG